MKNLLKSFALQQLARSCGAKANNYEAFIVSNHTINKSNMDDLSECDKIDYLYFVYCLDPAHKNLIKTILDTIDLSSISSDAYIDLFTEVFEKTNDWTYRNTLKFVEYFKDVICQRDELKAFCALKGYVVTDDYNSRVEIVRAQLKGGIHNARIALNKDSYSLLTNDTWMKYHIPITVSKTNYIRKNRFDSLVKNKYHLYLMFGPSNYDLYDSNNVLNVLKSDYKNGILTEDKILEFITFFGEQLLDYEFSDTININTMNYRDDYKILSERYLKIVTLLKDFIAQDKFLLVAKKYITELKKSYLYPRSYEEFEKLNPEYTAKYPRGKHDYYWYNGNSTGCPPDTYLTDDRSTDVFSVNQKEELIHKPYIYNNNDRVQCVLQSFDRDWFRTTVDYYCNL